MKVFIVSGGQDTGGQGFRIKQAFDRFGGPDFEVRSMRAKDNYIHYPSDLEWDPKLLMDLYEWADVVQFQNRLEPYLTLDRGMKKPTIIHHQGTRLRENSREATREARSIGAVQFVSTQDLLTHCPGSYWLPSPYDLGWLESYRYHPRTDDRPIRICHAPTNRRVKSTEIILRAANRLSKRYNIIFDLVENMPWKTLLSRKGRADIYVDQLKLGYGNNAIEAWGMGIPVIAGVNASNVYRQQMLRSWGSIPFYEASEHDIEQRLEELIVSKELRQQWGQIGQQHVQKYHDELKVVELLKNWYPEVPPSKGVEKFKPANEDLINRKLVRP